MATALAKHDSRFIDLASFCVPAVLAFAMFFSWIMLVNGLRIPFYLYYERTVFLIYVDRFLDPIIWLASSALAVILFAAGIRGRPVWYGISILLWCGIATGAMTIFGLMGPEIAIVGPLATLTGCVLAGVATIREATRRGRASFAVVFLLVLSLLFVPAELGSFLYYLLSAFQPGIEVGKSWELLEVQLWYTAFPLVPFLYAGFLFSWIWATILVKIPWKSRLVAGFNGPGRTASLTESRIWFVVIGGFVLLAGFLGYYPYFGDPAYPLVGTDIYWRNALPAERVLASTSWLAAAARERHPLVVLGIAVASKLSGVGVELLLRFAYVGLILVLGMTLFALVFAASRNKLMASVSAVMSAVSVSTTVGMYTGIVASWVALTAWVLTLLFLAFSRIRTLRGGFASILGLAVGSVAVLFIHPWTWIATMVGLVAYCIIMLLAQPEGYLRKTGSILAAILVNAGVLALSLFLLLRAQGWRVVQAFSLVASALDSKYFGFGSWEILVFFSQIWSQFLHPVLLALSILGVVVLARRRGGLCWIVLAWVAAACATNLLAAPMGYSPLDVNRGETQIFRALFLTPFQVPAAIGLLSLKSFLAGKMGRSREAEMVAAMIGSLLFLAVANGAFRALFPLLTDAHNYPNPLAP